MSESDAVVVITDCLPRRRDSLSDDVIVLDSPAEVPSRRHRRRNRANVNNSIVDLTCLPSDSSADLVDLTSPLTTHNTSTTINTSSSDLLIIEPSDPSPTSSSSGISTKKRRVESSPPEQDISTSSILRLNCPVCLEPLQTLLTKGEELRSTVCGHVFCHKCIKTAIRSSKKCPTCRKKLTEKQMHPLYLPIG